MATVFESVQRGAGFLIAADDHADELEAVAADAERAGDSELATMLRNRCRLVRNEPRTASGKVTIQRRDGTKFALCDVRANIRRAGRPTNVETRGNSPLAADMRRMSRDLRRAASEADQARIAAVLGGSAPKRSRPVEAAYFDDDFDVLDIEVDTVGELGFAN
ncbi:MAG: hypothetical protein K8U57_23110 [Planctomycetes bacterium]|nr:hypothetical protein [Planctomycetota bacterium]